MGLRFRNATPGLIACLVASVLLAIVSFNTPLLKSLNFLKASYSNGSLQGELTLGTLGFCHDTGQRMTCTGPQVGYEFDPNVVFGVSLFDIPKTITKYLTYILILHVVALAFAVIATIIALFAHSPTFPLLCLAIWMAGIASTFSFLAVIFDLAMFYIAKARINKVAGASAEIGICVWLTLASWIILALSGCFFGIGNCCGSCRSNQESGDPKRKYGNNFDRDDEEDYKMRMMAIDNERQRKAKQEQDLPSFQELTPLKDDGEEQYLIEHSVVPAQNHDQNLARNGSVLQGVGVGYGRRTPRTHTPASDYTVQSQNPYVWGQSGYQNIQPPAPAMRRLSGATSAGDFVGVGAGSAGVQQPPPVPAQQYGGNYADHNYQEQSYGLYGDQYNHNTAQYAPKSDYNSSYASQATQQPYDPYTQTNYYDPYNPSSNAVPAPALTMPQPTTTLMPVPQTSSQPSAHTTFYSTTNSSDSYDPGSLARHTDPYSGYEDSSGATLPQNAGTGLRGMTQLQEPKPQHLINTTTSPLLRSSPTPTSGMRTQKDDVVGTPQLRTIPGAYEYEDENEENSRDNRPPSYTAGDYQTPPQRREKSRYR
ncbi:uncharacterized protein L203_105458 [Cryptococcus depauperatus CBS 7841]|uniref:Uncharacterized protein n=1 Tax=Cryptococcus depauperatus CBS 7841 TaxID=1295531 RepID=A0A1E3ICT9_9TREE|nr:hypothetical protein L203_04135 [Cryptococcus depauperatus CBS 7841]